MSVTAALAMPRFIEVQFEHRGQDGVVTTSLQPSVEPGEAIEVGFQGPVTGLYVLSLSGREFSARLDPAYAVDDPFGRSLRYIPVSLRRC